MTPLLLSIVFQPFRFYEAVVTGQANYKRPESAKERWPGAAMSPSADQPRHMASQNALLSSTQPNWTKGASSESPVRFLKYTTERQGFRFKSKQLECSKNYSPPTDWIFFCRFAVLASMWMNFDSVWFGERIDIEDIFSIFKFMQYLSWI